MKFLALALPLIAVTPAAAESYSQNPNWSAWYGCWQAEGAPAGELVCIAPMNNGVRIATLVDGSVRDESTVIADGASRAVQSVGCSGTERARWSSDRRRVFLESDVACGASGRRSVRGLFAFVAPDAWISVQSATEGDSVATRVVRFTAADPRGMPAIAAAFGARSSFSDALLDVEEADVNEAVSHIGAEAAQEWMRMAGEPFELGYNAQDRGTGSALEQVGRMSNPVVVREVVRVVERPVYVYDSYYDRYRWSYSPWGYHYHGWHWYRPVVVVRWPIVIHRNTYYRRDYWRYDRDRYGRYDYDRYRRDRYDNSDRRGRDDDRYDNSRGRLTRDGYSSGRDRNATTNTTRSEAQRVEPQRAEPPQRTRESDRRAVPRAIERSTPREESRASSREESRATSREENRASSRESTRSAPRASSPSRSSGSSGNSRGAPPRTARPRN